MIIGNPPYNAGQLNENDENKNRKYTTLDRRIADTYTHDSQATNLTSLGDPYVKAFRWASDRIGRDGVICFVSNNSFVDQIAFDGMRKNLLNDFSRIVVLDLGGNVRKNPKLSGTTHNVFGIQVGVVITLLIRTTRHQEKGGAEIYYADLPVEWRKEQKYQQLDSWGQCSVVPWTILSPNASGTWLKQGERDEFAEFVPLGAKVGKGAEKCEAICRSFGRGVLTNRDAYNYNYDRNALLHNVQVAIDVYNNVLSRYQISTPRPKPDDFVDVNDIKIKWTRQTKALLSKLVPSRFDPSLLRRAVYRPFSSQNLYFQDFWNEERYQQPRFFPLESLPNVAISASGIGAERPFATLATNHIPDLNFFGPGTVPNWFPFYTYDKDGSNCRDNITDWALEAFRNHYSDRSITKWNIFHVTYAVLHHHEYRARYIANLKRELPRIPFVPDFKRYAEIGVALMKLHIEYEDQPEYPLVRAEKGKLDWRVEKMVLSKDKTQLHYNDFLTLREIPPETYEYRLGNRSALEWIVDQYRICTDSRSGIVNDPNRTEDDEYIVRLIGQVVALSLETVKLTRELATLPLVSA